MMTGLASSGAGLVRFLQTAAPASSAVIASLFAVSCGAQPSSDSAAKVHLTALEIHELQTSTPMEVAQVVEGVGARYAIPRAPYVRLGEVGRGTPTAYYQAWLDLKAVIPPTQYPDQTYPVRDKISVSVGFLEPGIPIVPVPGEGWVRSEVGIPEFPQAELWLDTEQCIDDRPPRSAPDRFDVRVRAVWTIAETPLQLSCRASLNAPNGRHNMTCFGGSAPTPSGVTYGFYGGGSLDQGCRAALEGLARSFAPLPLIVADWRME